MTTTAHLNRICRGFHGANIQGHLVTVTGSKGDWTVIVDGETIGTCTSLLDAEIAAELHIMAVA